VITVLCGGVGAARLLSLLQRDAADFDYCAVVNVADDLILHGLTICPDLDTVTYTLANLNNEVTGWGLVDETWRVNKELAELGGEAWFQLGDRDLATHLYRTERLNQGATKTEVASELALHHGVTLSILPASNDPVATFLETDIGELSFQEYFVKHRHAVPVSKITFRGAEVATPSAETLDALRTADRVLIAPSNPLLSIAPILAIPGISESLRDRRNSIAAVSPLIGGRALKGPADHLMTEMGFESSSFGVAAYYGELVGHWFIDEVDAGQASRIEELGATVTVLPTIMTQPGSATALAQGIAAWLNS
jgi:LPPG:FO 2-phospho-L-lactate transferase